MTVSQRLYLAMLPGILGVFAVAALAYWGQYGRQAPHVLVGVAVVVSVTSLIVAWRNARYVATRVTRLAAPSRIARFDELDAIEHEVQDLRQAVADARADEASAEQRAEASTNEYGGLVADAAMSAARQLDQIRMPLYILLENRFGDLNENQEEMLAAAGTAADEARSYLERLGEIADLDRGALRFRNERIRLADLVTALVPSLTAEARRSNIRVSTDLAPVLPPVAGDRARLAEVLSVLAADALRRTLPGGALLITAAPVGALPPPTGQPSDRVTSHRDVTAVQLVLTHGAGPSRQTDVSLANRLVKALGGQVDYGADRTVITLPVYASTPGPAGGAEARRSHTS